MNDKKAVNSFCLDNLKGLIDTKKSRTEIAAALGCDVSTIAKHYNGSRDVTTEYVLKYAKYFNVSTDYIFGLTNHKTALDSEEGEIIRAVCDYTGLSEEAVEVLNFSKTNHTHNRSHENNSLYSQNDKYSYFFSSDFISEILENINQSLLFSSIMNYSTSKYDALEIFDKICSMEKVQSKDELYSLNDFLNLGATNLKICKVSYIEIIEEFQSCISTALDYNSEVLSEKQMEAFNKMLKLNVDYGGENNGKN